MTARRGDALRQLSVLARPSSLGVLWRAGMIEPRGLAGAVRTLPWLLGRGASLGILSHLNARAMGPKPAIHDRWGTLTWAELDRRANRLARALIAEGAGPGQTVATVLRNGREIGEVLLATQKLGAVVCPLNTWARPEELRVALEAAAPRLLLYDSAHEDQVREAAPEGLRLVRAGGLFAQAGGAPYDRILAGPPDLPLGPLTRRPGTPDIVVHTSGTTGRPKGARRGGRSQSARALVHLLSVIPLRRNDVILCPAPLFHSFGLLVFTLGSFLGATFVFPFGFEPEVAPELIERHGVTAVALVPVMLRRLLGLPKEAFEGRDLSTVRIVLSGGAALPEDLREAAVRRFGPVVYDLYGSTEAGWVAVATPEDMAARPDTVGRPVPGVEVAILGRDGDPVPTGEVGEIHVRSDAAFDGYTTGEESPLRGPYLTTGDLGRLDRDGRLLVEGRADDLVVVGGENVYPAEVEAVIRQVDGVEDVAVTGIPDTEYGQVLAAYVVGEVASAPILEACRASLASYKVPRQVEQVSELPRTATGKVILRDLPGSAPQKE